MGSETSDPAAGDAESTDRKGELWQAFQAGFATGRRGKYYADLAAISERAARTEFEQFYKSTFSDHR